MVSMKEIASLIYWKSDLTKEEVEKVIWELSIKGLIQSETTREYNPCEGEPVWYIP
jgi:hypothetical protein